MTLTLSYRNNGAFINFGQPQILLLLFANGMCHKLTQASALKSSTGFTIFLMLISPNHKNAPTEKNDDDQI